jgi:hypothetical protein
MMCKLHIIINDTVPIKQSYYYLVYCSNKKGIEDHSNLFKKIVIETSINYDNLFIE